MLHFALALLLHATSASITTTTNAHYSDVLKIKCEALPVRSVYREANCYFVIDVDSEGAAKQCPTVLAGSKFTGNAPDAVWRSLFVEKSEFLREADSTSAKKAMCLYESKFTCSTGSSTSIPGKCVQNGDSKMTYRQAETFCIQIGSLPSPQNDLENRIVAAATKSAVWLRPAYSKTWSDRTDFSRFGTCAASPFSAAKDPEWCSSNVAVVANPNATSGYWALAGQTTALDVLCVGDANSEYYTAKPKPKPKPAKKDCWEHHAWDEETSRCEWSGPKDACVQLFHNNGKSMYVGIPRYPSSTAVHAILWETTSPYDIRYFEDATKRAIVRRGCMATFWAYRQRDDDPYTEIKMLKNVEYGDYYLPSVSNGGIAAGIMAVNGLSRVSCYCDPLETEKEKPAKAECVEHHEWDEQKRKCVWKLDNNIAGEIETHEGKKMMLEIPNWPFNKRYDVNLHYATLPDFIYKVTRIIVRQGCFCTIYSNYHLSSAQPRPTVGYGIHDVASKYAKKPLANVNHGSLRVVCECMNKDGGKERLIRNPEPPKCIELHTYDENTKRCEWTGPEYSCAKLTNTLNQTMMLPLEKCGNKPCVRGAVQFYATKTNKLSNAVMKNWDRQLTHVTVRQGCIVNVYVARNNPSTYFYMHRTIEAAKYGTYRVPQKEFGDIEGGYSAHLGANEVVCVCQPSPTSIARASPTVACLEGHVYDQQTGQCEWTRDKRICAVITNDAGQTMNLMIQNYPFVQSMVWFMAQSKGTVSNTPLFLNRIASVLVRQSCFVTMKADKQPGESSYYGIYKPRKGTVTIGCACAEN